MLRVGGGLCAPPRVVLAERRAAGDEFSSTKHAASKIQSEHNLFEKN
jgi:hypothetical protein